MRRGRRCPSARERRSAVVELRLRLPSFADCGLADRPAGDESILAAGHAESVTMALGDGGTDALLGFEPVQDQRLKDELRVGQMTGAVVLKLPEELLVKAVGPLLRLKLGGFSWTCHVRVSFLSLQL